MYRHRKHRCTMNNEVLQRKKEKIFKKEIEKLKEELEKKDEIISNIKSAVSTSIQTQVKHILLKVLTCSLVVQQVQVERLRSQNKQEVAHLLQLY